MTIIAKAIRAIEAITELPSALHACVEMAREAEHLRRLDAMQYSNPTNAAETTRLRTRIDNLTGHCNVLTEEKSEAIADKIAATSRRGRAESKLATVEDELKDARVRLHNAIGRTNEAMDALSEWQGWAMSKAGSIACSTDVDLRGLIDSTISVVEAELAREREARRRRRQSEEPCPFHNDEMIGWEAGSCKAGALEGDDVWYYLAPEDMP